jgi:hypothetical protein
LRKRITALAAVGALVLAANAAAAGWNSSVPFTNQVASVPVDGAGYPDPDGTPEPGTCTAGSMNSNRSESWIAVQPGTENALGMSKFFFDKYSTFYNFYLGAYTITNGAVGQNTFLPGYDCVTTKSQEMPPSWTNNTDPVVDFDSQGRAYSISLPFNAYWTNLHPNGAISGDYSDDLGKTWTRSAGADKFGFIEQRDEPVPRRLRGQAVGGRQQVFGVAVSRPRLRDVGDLQRPGHQAPPVRVA